MANQFTDSFKHIVLKKFGKSAEIVLQEFAAAEKNYAEVAEITGFKTGTIRKYCKQYNIELRLCASTKNKKVAGIDKINLKSKEVDASNFLYRKWQPVDAIEKTA